MTDYRCTILTPHWHSSFDDPIECEAADSRAAADRKVRTSRLAIDHIERNVRAKVAAEIAAFADDDSDVSDAYRHAALIATQGATE